MAVGAYPIAVNPVTGALTYGTVTGDSLAVAGTAGAPNVGRWVGVTTAGPPTSGTYAVGDWCLSQNGQMFVCVVAGTPGTWTTPVDTRNLISTGEETIDRNFTAGASALTSGSLRLCYFTARKTETSTQGKVTTASTAAGATPTLCRFGVYSVATNGDLTLLSACANDTTLFAAASTAYTRSWTASFAKVAGVTYAFGVLVVTGAAQPTFPGLIYASAVTPTTAPKRTAQLSGQTDLPASIVAGTLGGSAIAVYGEILP